MAGNNGNGSSSSAAEPAVCPVDHKTREAWLEQARAQTQAQARGQAEANKGPAAPAPAPAPAPASSSWFSLWSTAAAPPPSAPPPPTIHPRAPALGTERVVSSIPRTATAPDSPPTAARPVNHEVETGADPATGHWVYPSEKMFFEAMRRKGNEGARVADMKVVVPIHNAVNERAWKEICAWEAPYTGSGPGRCAAGPRLHSFAGLSTARLTPRARLNTLLGYSAPFDRHDWVVDRCGQQIDYVIDFYAGRPGSSADAAAATPGAVSFYLDVRPKLNSWTGIKMRLLRCVGWQ